MGRRKNEHSPYERTLRRAEKSMIEFAVEQAGSLRAAAPLLGVSVSFLITRAKKLGVSGKKPEEALSKDEWKTRAKAAEAKAREKKRKEAAQEEPPNNVVQLTRPEPEPEEPEGTEETDVEEAPQPEGA